jgi:hypothetical protein
MVIYVFKTSVKGIKEVGQLKPHLNKLLKDAKWNFDLEDCDKILRIDSLEKRSKEVVELLQEKGFECEELTN